MIFYFLRKWRINPEYSVIFPSERKITILQVKGNGCSVYVDENEVVFKRLLAGFLWEGKTI